MFKEQFPKHDKGKSKADNQDNSTKISYDYDSIVNHISMNNHVSTINIKDKTFEGSTQRGKVILKCTRPSSSSTLECNGMTHQGKITLQGVQSKPMTFSSIKNENYLVDQFGKTPTLISILLLLCISPSHKVILNKALRETFVPTDLNMDQFQSMVGYLSTRHCLTSTKVDDATPCQPHNAPLHIEEFLHKSRIK